MAKIIKVSSLAGIPRKYSIAPAVKNIGYVKLNTDRYHGYHRRNIEFCLRLKSSVKFAEDQLDEQKITTPFPHVFIKQPPYLHKYNYNANREAFFIIYPVELRPTLLNCGLPLDQNVVEFKMNDKIAHLIAQINDLLQESDVSGVVDEIDGLALTLLVTVFNSQTSDAVSGAVDENLFHLQKLASYLKMHYNDKIAIDDVALRFGFSRRNFYRQWKQYYNCTPREYILKLKIDEACQLLENQFLSVRAIAERLNFVDSSYFIATFKKYMLQTPLKYRDQLGR